MRITRLAPQALPCLALLGLALLPLGCGDDTVEPMVDEPWVPAPTMAANLVPAIEAIYDDTEHDAEERMEAYGNLFADDFVFWFEPNDIAEVGRESWARADEVAAHQAIFEAQDAGGIVSLTLEIEFLDAVEPTPPREDGALLIDATDVNLTLLTGPDDGFAVQAGRATFYVSEDADRWWINEWQDLPSRNAKTSESSSWGKVKAQFSR